MSRLRLISVGLALLGVVMSTVAVGHFLPGHPASTHECVACLHATASAALVVPGPAITVAVAVDTPAPSAAAILPAGRVLRPTGRAPPLAIPTV